MNKLHIFGVDFGGVVGHAKPSDRLAFLANISTQFKNALSVVLTRDISHVLFVDLQQQAHTVINETETIISFENQYRILHKIIYERMGLGYKFSTIDELQPEVSKEMYKNSLLVEKEILMKDYAHKLMTYCTAHDIGVVITHTAIANPVAKILAEEHPETEVDLHLDSLANRAHCLINASQWHAWEDYCRLHAHTDLAYVFAGLKKIDVPSGFVLPENTYTFYPYNREEVLSEIELTI